MIIERNTDIAAALASLRCVVTPEKATEADGGTQRIHFILGPKYQMPDSPQPCSVSALRNALRENKLSPPHPVSRQLLAAENRRAVLAFLKQPHVGIRLVARDGAFAVINEKGQGLAGRASVAGTGAVIYKTRSLRTVVGLMTAGYDLLWIDGPDHAREFFLQCHGPEGSAVDLLRMWKTEPKSFPPNSVFLLAMAFLTNRDVLMQYVEKYKGRLILRKRNSSRQITIPETASGRTWDKARRFLIG